ncbi:amino acid ABC transporter permease [Rhabdothermincola salaria]|uniref:amino acid ABC transporter permease n=1 Tax=Rhabdothermincola salaria TaxID=2903142 RepID=UPI001E324FAF|nr:amino acid ABC transporter permease [Rhabdothermincola salaria]MCD9624054.1 amino acid ABC transporter permease [Rhabdothermincola salaria]
MDVALPSFYYERLFEGMLVTLQVLLYAFLIGVALSIILGVARLSSSKTARTLSLIWIEFTRGISSIVLLFWMAYALPILLGIRQPSLLLMGSIALGLNMGGYGGEIVRGAIQSVPKGQTEASIALNLSEFQRLRYVVLPQSLRVILPPMGNLTIEILKGTALVSLISLSDLAFEGTKLRTSGRLNPDAPSAAMLFLNILLIYFVLSQIISGLYRLAEWRVNRRFEGARTEVELPDATTTTAGAG